MATRLYFSAAPAPVTTLPFGAPWSVTTGATRRALVGAQDASVLFDQPASETTTNAFTNRLVAQFVSDTLATDQLIMGTVSAVIRGAETAGAKASLQMAVLVYAADGTLRGTLYSGHGSENNATPGALGQELPVTPQGTRIIPAVSLNPVAAKQGDRVVVALGSRNRNNVATAMTTTLRIGAPVGADFALSAGLETDLTPWVQFSQSLAFGAPPEQIELPSGVPFDKAAPELIRSTHRQDYFVQAYHPTAGVIPLDVERCQIDWDEARAPRVSATIDCKVPPDQATMDLLDPRQGVRIEVFAGYVFDSGSDVHLIGDLNLRERTVVRPDNTLELTAVSDESLVIDSKTLVQYDPLQDTVQHAINGLIEEALPHAHQFFNTTPTVAPGELVRVERGGDWWDVMKDLTDRIDAELFDDGLRRWFLRPRPQLAGEPSADLRVGDGGVVETSETTLSRDGEWANAVLVKYTWTDTTGGDHEVWGTAEATGTMAFSVVGRKIYSEDRPDIAISQTEANRVATAILARRLAYGRTFRLRAVSAYWLRPGMTVNVKLPSGDEEKHLVKAVSFDLTQGWMDVDTRLPDYVNTPGE